MTYTHQHVILYRYNFNIVINHPNIYITMVK